MAILVITLLAVLATILIGPALWVRSSAGERALLVGGWLLAFACGGLLAVLL